MYEYGAIWRTALVILACVSARVDGLHAQSHGPLEPLSYLAGTWTGENRGSGPAVNVEIRYFWGPTSRILYFETYDLLRGGRALLYEGHIIFDPKSGIAHQTNVKPNGEVSRSEIIAMDSVSFTVKGKSTLSFVRRSGSDAYTWLLQVPENGAWREVMRVEYRRR